MVPPSKFMDPMSVHGFTSPTVIDWGDSVFDVFCQAIEDHDFTLQDRDVVIVTSKVVSMEENSRAELSHIQPSPEAMSLAETTRMDPRVVQLVLDEANGEVFGGVFHAILAKTNSGLSANAGIDLSNCPEGYALLLPRDPDRSARSFRQKVLNRYGKKVAVLVTDSRTIPLKRGTTGVTLGIAGMHPVIDERGKKDLYGYTMTITTRAVADNLATVANMVMGETSERRPFAVIRNVEFEETDEEVSMSTTLMPEDECLYFGPLLKLIREARQ